MAITIIITESPLEKVSGIPDTITLTTNVPATIFYTLDGSEPTYSSLVVIEPISLPTENSVVLKAFATDGLETSPTITEYFGANMVPLRRPRDKITGIDDTCKTRFPFGSSSRGGGVNGVYQNSGGITVDNPLISGEPSGFDGSGTAIAETDLKYPDNYDVIFSETDRIGQRGRGIGTLPAEVVIIRPPPNTPQQSSDANSPFFNPKALVIFQDGSQESADPEIPRINRPYFNLEDTRVARDGALLNPTEPMGPSGSLLKTQYNPVNNTVNYYYYDNRTNRWIISKEPFYPKASLVNNLSQIFQSRATGSVGLVFKWVPFKYRVLM